MTAALSVVPMNRTGNQRARLYQTLAGCLPGRVYAYAPSNALAAQVAPAIWIGAGCDGALDRPAHVATWRVWAIADGAGHAAQAMLDELVSVVVGALAATNFTVEGWVTTTWDVADVEYPAVTFDVSATLSTTTLCPPIPTEALVPPEVHQP